jgi:alpha-L-fucosidase
MKIVSNFLSLSGIFRALSTKIGNEDIFIFGLFISTNQTQMNKISTMIRLFAVLIFSNPVVSQTKINPDEIAGKMQWFADAKLGIFIHAGIYAVNGVDESWSFYNKKIGHREYMQQLEGFTLENYNPAFWADLIAETGAGYAVITTKHHDGVAMYDTQLNDLSSVKSTPSQTDMVTPLFRELRKRGIRCGAYFSLIDWTHHDYPGFLKDSSRYRLDDDYERWYRYRDFFQGQIMEIQHNFNPDLWWFDGDWEHSAEKWEAEKIKHSILKANPNAIINGRLQGYGDYETPEQNFPVQKPACPWWELCMTTNDNWGFQHNDQNWKSPFEVITIFADIISYGGNLLLNFGPKEDGSIPDESVYVLKELGSWTKKHSEAIFGSLPGLPQGHFYGPTTLSKDSTNLYLFLHGNPKEQVVLKGLFNEVKSIEVLGKKTYAEWKIVGKISWSPVPGLVYISISEKDHDKYLTVLKVSLNEPVKLYRGKGGLGL